MLNMESIPEQLIVDILLRLPVKSLLRFKSVSKLWRSLISDPRFAQSHFQMSSSRADRIVHIADSGARSIDFHSSFHDDSAIANLNFPITLNVMIRGSCRGFVLLDVYDHLFIWNPSTGFYKHVPYFPMPSPVCPFVLGLGYDATDDDYLLLIGACDPYDDDCGSDFQFFSTKANSWKKIEGTGSFPYMNATDDARAGVFLNEAIHWLAFRHDTSVELILAFNVIQRKLVEIPLPGDFFETLEFVFLGTLGGYLSLYVVDDDLNGGEIWLMKEYGTKSSWTKSMVVSVEIPCDFLFPICLTESCEIVGSDGRNGIVKCNEKGQVLERGDYNYQMFEQNTVVYTESLLSLPCDGGEGGEDKQQ
ncbi:F-box/kelch-repeat protein At3g23880-like isoform X2 [Prosopis cineraria]|uniref:F-box/kelch-repeat protein At3g23880-like isoform X2 n=1 Tax=Prosopis cineraria TaxID=364024 RepID=UPI0024107A31|nr:F-box/kelch-repeat protein At3g23880-like isoform X2 [Prosopis cineraria]